MKPTTNEKIIYHLVKSGELEIDNQGQIWRVKKKTGLKAGGTLLRPCKRVRAEREWGGYLQIRAMVNWKRYHCQAHRLVFHHFHGPIPDGVPLNHKNGKKMDNRPENLELTTYSENIKHAYQTGLKDQNGEKNPAHKLTDLQVEEIRVLYARGELNQSQLAAKYGVVYQTISRTVRGEIKKAQHGPTADYSHRRQTHRVTRNRKGQFSSV